MRLQCLGQALGFALCLSALRPHLVLLLLEAYHGAAHTCFAPGIEVFHADRSCRSLCILAHGPFLLFCVPTCQMCYGRCRVYILCLWLVQMLLTYFYLPSSLFYVNKGTAWHGVSALFTDGFLRPTIYMCFSDFFTLTYHSYFTVSFFLH